MTVKTLAECVVAWQALVAASPAIPEEHDEADSPCSRYRLTRDQHGGISVLVVRRVGSADIAAVVLRDDDRNGYGFAVGHPRGDYFLCPDTLAGQAVVDLATGSLRAFDPGPDGFIWTDVFPSSDSTRLAVFGCYWACPYEVVAYDFRDPLNLPLTALMRHDLFAPAGYAVRAEWATPDSFALRYPDGSSAVHAVPRPAGP